MKRIIQYTSILVLIGLMQNVVQAQTNFTSVSSGQWSNSAIWSPSGVPNAGDNVTIASGHTVTLTAPVDITIGNLTVSGTIALAGFNLTAGSLSGAGNIGSASGSPLLTVGSNGSNTSYSGIFSGTGTQLTKTGLGALTLLGANTYSGTTTISGGTLSLGNGGTIGSIASASIVNNAALIFNRSNNITYTGVISGTGTLTKEGAGTLFLTGTNTYTGTTTISAGTLSIGNGGLTGTIAGTNIVNNAALVFNMTNAQTCTGVISGTGTLMKMGSNTLTLSGNNTYSGSTTINTGTISINADNRLGQAPASPTPGHLVFLNNGVLDVTANFTLNANRGILISSGDGIFNGAFNVTYGGIIDGPGNLFVQCNLTLNGASANTYAGSTKVVLHTLTINNDNKLGPVPASPTPSHIFLSGGTLSASTTLTLNANRGISLFTATSNTISIGSGTLTYGGIIAGQGNLIKTGNGTLILSGSNTYTGSTTISAGILSIGSGSTSGVISNSSNITNNASLIINRSDAYTYSGVISGTGSLTKQGAGIFTLSGANTYSGATGVSAGTLVANNASAFGSTPSLTLSGTGSVRTDVAVSMHHTALAITANTAKFNCNGLDSYFGQLTLGGVLQASNSYGSLASAATIKTDQYFSSGVTGVILAGDWTMYRGGSGKGDVVSASPMEAMITVVGPASDSPTLCINNELIPITHSTNGATGIGTPTGLPAGVTANWSSDIITISGTPTSSGTFNYSIPLIGDFDGINATGVITVNPLNSAGIASSTPSVCLNTTLTPITHSTTVATGIGTPSGLPNGVSANWAGNTITISGAPTSTGTFNYSIPLTGGCGTVSASGSIIVSENNSVGIASASPSLCPNNTLIPITHTTTGATSIGTATGLPSGVSASWSNNIITISGTPTESGVFSYVIPLNSECENVNATGSITLFSNCYDWVSTSSTNWNLASNWLQNEVPTENSRIQISATATANLSLDQNRKIESLNLNERGIKVVLGNNNLTINGSIQGENLSSYILTNSNGSVSTTLNNGATKKFPVGQADYNPVTITNYNTTADSISVRVKDSVLLEAYSGTPVNTVNVQRTWFIKKNNANDSGVDFVFEWDTTQQSGFMPGYYLNHFDGTNWEIADFDNYSQPVKNGSRVTLSMFGYKGGFSPFTFGDSPSSPLPVELLSLTGTCIDDKKLLRWSTASEKDSWFYQVEHSTDGQNWLSGDKIPAAGNSNSLLNYEWLLDNRTDLVYVRLQQHDLDGAFTTYGPIVVNCENENSFGLFPNPTRDAVNVVFSSQQEGNSFFVEVQDLAGKKVYETQFLGVSGSNSQRINTDFAPGIYTVSLWESGRLMGRKQLLIQ